jgi:hypothetical protein
MISKGYQRRHLRAPFRENLLYCDAGMVLRARGVNISEGAILIDEIPRLPQTDDIALLISLPQIPALKNFSLLKLQTFSRDLFQRHIIRARASVVRREQLANNLENIFRYRFVLEFTHINLQERKYIDEYVLTFASNLVYLQTLIDSFNSDDEAKIRTRLLATILGYKDVEKISLLRTVVAHDYRGLHWI